MGNLNVTLHLELLYQCHSRISFVPGKLSSFPCYIQEQELEEDVLAAFLLPFLAEETDKKIEEPYRMSLKDSIDHS